MTHLPEVPTASGTTGWTVESVLIHLNGALRDMKERFVDALKEMKESFFEALAAQEKKNQQQFADADKAVRAAMAAASTASDKAEQNSEKWRANANEWRSAMNDRERNFAPIPQLQALEKVQDEIREEMARVRQIDIEARNALRTEFMREIAGLRESRSNNEGDSSGSNRILGYIIAGTGLIISALIALSHWRVV